MWDDDDDDDSMNGKNFTGYTYDRVIGKYFAQYRFYDAVNKRFMAVDPVKDGSNWYTYVNSNPASFVDPLGLAQDPGGGGVAGYISKSSVDPQKGKEIPEKVKPNKNDYKGGHGRNNDQKLIVPDNHATIDPAGDANLAIENIIDNPTKYMYTQEDLEYSGVSIILPYLPSISQQAIQFVDKAALWFNSLSATAQRFLFDMDSFVIEKAPEAIGNVDSWLREKASSAFNFAVEKGGQFIDWLTENPYDLTPDYFESPGDGCEPPEDNINYESPYNLKETQYNNVKKSV